ncbi:hypothetical protein C1646_755822 [Rhizophagus diaphanus]|nr:hypothetical protein C1646_755822 [Rhizophagus diaphanus] [Rhizophagus sp. MUCL 43196]
MQQVPVEVAERIITNLSDEDLFIGNSEIQAIREREQNEEIEWQEASYAVEELNNYMGVFTRNQVYIMNKMLKYEMIVDSQKREIIEYASSKFNWEGNP